MEVPSSLETLTEPPVLEVLISQVQEIAMPLQRRWVPMAAGLRLLFHNHHSPPPPTTPPPEPSPSPAPISPLIRAPATTLISPNSPSPEKAATPTPSPAVTLNSPQPPPSRSPSMRLINSKSLVCSIKTAPPQAVAPPTTSLLL